jgi:hypothetical protein
MGTISFHDNKHDIRAVSSDRKCTDIDVTERVIPLLFDLSYGQIKVYFTEKLTGTQKRGYKF